MFKFDFDIDNDDEEDQPPAPYVQGPAHSPPSSHTEPDLPESSATGAARYRKITLDDLIELLPPAISFSPLRVRFPPTLSGGKAREEITILRRDLYDARFQILEDVDSSDEDDAPSSTTERDPTTDGSHRTKDDQKYVDAETDLIPGTYEGGLKTWEGGADLVDVLQEFDEAFGSGDVDGKSRGGLGGGWLAGKRILEIGCGTGLPSLYLLQKVLSASHHAVPAEQFSSGSFPSSDRAKTTFHLQDYNISVLHLVTLPNIILSVLPESYIQSHATPSNDLELSEGLLAEFKRVLESANVELEFSYGDWAAFGLELREGRKAIAASKERGEANPVETIGFDLILTAETIYRQESVDSLIAILKNGARQAEPRIPDDGAIAEPAEKLSSLSIRSDPVWTLPLTLVAAKVLYFGVGGGIRDFLDRVRAEGGTSEDVKVWQSGVGRKVVRVDW